MVDYKRVKELEEVIKESAQKYYQGEETITDVHFDKLVKELRELDPTNEVVNTVGWGFNIDRVALSKRNHYVPMGSLSNISPEDYIEDLKSEDMLVTSVDMTPKLDGAAVQVTYKYGVLVSALTRGDGIQGHDVTNKLRHIIPEVLPADHVFSEMKEVSIAGEFILRKNVFETKYVDAIAHRNIASGYLLRSHVDDNIYDFDFVAFRITRLKVDHHVLESRVDNKFLVSRHNMLDVIELAGLRVVPIITVVNVNDYDYTTYEDVFNKFSNINYYIDGVVASSGSTRSDISNCYMDQDRVRVVDIKYNEIAIKKNTEGVLTKVTGIEYSMTRTGKAVPVIKIDPVEVSGAIVSKVAGHNFMYLQENGIDEGSVVKVVRSGEVIPYISEVVNEVGVLLSMHQFDCPDCGNQVQLVGRDLMCTNEECRGKDRQDLERWVSYNGYVKGIGSSLRNTMIDGLDLVNVSDIYTKELDISALEKCDGVGSKSLDLIKQSLDLLLGEIEFRYFLVGSNVKGISINTAEKLERDSNLVECLDNNTPELFSVVNCKGVGHSVRTSIIDNWDKLLNIYNAANIIPSKYEEEEVVEGRELVKVSITGKLEIGTRKQFLEKYSNYVEEVNVKDAEYLITNNPDGSSSKLKTAKDSGIEIISENDFINNIIDEVVL